MAPAFQNILVQLGAAGLLIGFMYLRLQRADKQLDKKDEVIEKLQTALIELSIETAKSLNEMKTLLQLKEQSRS